MATLPSTLHTSVSPPRTSRRSISDNKERRHTERRSSITRASPASSQTKSAKETESPSLAAIEAGQVQVGDHLSIFSSRLLQSTRPLQAGVPRLSHAEWVDLYLRNQNPHGRHFVIHQHDHPVAGPHYDLRLQISDTSSVSWAIMYGLPGDPNSRRSNRNATETRVHCLWNHLIEAASPSTGSMIIWDTGEYSILPYNPETKEPETEDSLSDHSEASCKLPKQIPDSEKLREAFQNRKIRLRLHGTRLPPNYTITMRLTSLDNVAIQPTKTPRKRRRRTAPSLRRQPSSTPSTSPSPQPEHLPSRTSSVATLSASGTAATTGTPKTEHEAYEVGSASASDEENSDQRTRLTNAYPGATNSVGSIHQRRWFITLDRASSGFEPISASGESASKSGGRKTWVRRRSGEGGGELLGFEPFYVRGPDAERSVVTGRLGKEVLDDEGVEGFVPRKGWRAVLG